MIQTVVQLEHKINFPKTPDKNSYSLDKFPDFVRRYKDK